MIDTKNLSYKESGRSLHRFHLLAKKSYIDLYTDRKKESEYIWLIENDKEIGFLSYSINEIPDSGQAFIYVVKIYIFREYRGSNLSLRLFDEIEKIEDLKKKLNINIITLVSANKILEEKLYKKIGFKYLTDMRVLEIYSKVLNTNDPLMYRLKKRSKVEKPEEIALFGI